METNFDKILVFATNIKTKSDKQKLSSILDKNAAINTWTVDQEDVDCVLRVESNTLSTNQIIEIVNNHNFECTELE